MKAVTIVGGGLAGLALGIGLRRQGVPVPVTDEVHAVLHEGKRPLDAVRALMARDVKPE